jgi:hypothetical protein
MNVEEHGGSAPVVPGVEAKAHPLHAELAALRAENERLTQALREITLIGPGDVGDGNRSWSYVLAQARRIARDALEATS